MMTADEFCKRCINVAQNVKTAYVWGGFGLFLDEKGINRSLNAYEKNKNYETAMRQVKDVGFAMDCCGMIKAILWGFDASHSTIYGGGLYQSNGVPDIGADTIIKRCNNVSTDFSNIKPGEAVWMSGHIGVYVGFIDGIGDACVVECTPKWENPNGVKISGIKSCGYTGSRSRVWTKHGFLPWVDYTKKEEPKEEPKEETEEKGEIEVLYHTIDDVPDWGKEAIKWFVDKGYIAGVGGGDLSLTNDLLRTLVVLYRVLQNNNITQ